MEKNQQARKKFIRIVLVASICILLFLTFASIRRIVILTLFILLNFGFAFLKHKIPTVFVRKYLFGIEFVLFCTVITSIAFGPVIGASMGGLMMVVNYIGERRLSEYVVTTTLSYIVIGFVSYYLRGIPFVQAGLILTVSYNISAFFMSKFQGANIVTLIIFNLTNILFNALLFVQFGPFVMSLL